jgi:ketosteroid isomerase-like protein
MPSYLLSDKKDRKMRFHVHKVLSTLQVIVLAFLMLLTFSSSASSASSTNSDKQKIKNVLIKFHQAAASANFETYFDLLSRDAIFLGTDASERWTKEAFKEYVRPAFSKGNGWLYTPRQQNIGVIKKGQVAFFDELLSSESYGICRSSGILIKTSKGWKISQYNLSIPIPNELAKEFSQKIKSFQKADLNDD